MTARATRDRVRTRVLTGLIDNRLSRRLAGPPATIDGRTIDPAFGVLCRLATWATPSGEPDPTRMRRDLERLQAVGPARHGEVHVTDRYAPGPAGAVPVRIYRPAGIEEPAPAVVYLHGGGWVCGSVRGMDVPCHNLATDTASVVVSVDYRLAPEHPYPAAVEDSVAAYRWVHGAAGSLGIRPDRIAVMGDSAGGNLAAIVAQQLRGADVDPPVAQGLVYPVTDMLQSSASYRSVGTGFVLEASTMEWFRRLYVPDPSHWTSPLASPLAAVDLADLPPALVATAGFDPLRDEGIAYAEALRAAGNQVIEIHEPDLIHGYYDIGVVRRAVEASAAINRRMAELLRPVAAVDLR